MRPAPAGAARRRTRAVQVAPSQGRGPAPSSPRRVQNRLPAIRASPLAQSTRGSAFHAQLTRTLAANLHELLPPRPSGSNKCTPLRRAPGFKSCISNKWCSTVRNDSSQCLHMSRRHRFDFRARWLKRASCLLTTPCGPEECHFLAPRVPRPAPLTTLVRSNGPREKETPRPGPAHGQCAPDPEGGRRGSRGGGPQGPVRD